MADKVRFEPDRAGIIELFTSQAMQDFLGEVAEPLERQVNAMADGHASALGLSHGFETEPYEAAVVVLDRTAVARVGTATSLGALDNAKFGTLESINH